MANDNQFKLKCIYVGTRGVSEYRQSIEKYVDKDDYILEIGCEWGTTSRLIHKKCKNLLATDVSHDCILKAKELYPKINFAILDVFNIRKALEFKIPFTKMYIDVSGLSGYRSLLDVIALMEMYASVFNLKAIIIKSGSFKNFAGRCVSWNGQ